MAKVKKPINEGGADLTIESAPQENMSGMIEVLVEKASKVTCWPDANGLTPLHRVASLITPYNILFTVFILDRCPQSAEVCDNSGKSILHLLINKITNYPDAKNLLNIEEIYALRNYQDNQGNTPLHIAAQNLDSVMVRVLLESSAKLNINNADGISAACIIQQQDMLQILRNRQLTIREIEAVDTANVTFLTERMRTLGMDFLLSKDAEGRNILHRLMRIRKESHVNPEDFVNFIELALEIFPSLISQADKNGDTPMHILVRNSPNTRIYVASRVEDNKQYNHSDEGTGDSDRRPFVCVVLTLKESNILSLCLKKCNECILRIEDEAKHKGHCFDSPWLVQNVEGNTPLHEALKSDENIKLVELLLNYNKESISVTNKDNETPLHLFATRIVGIEQFDKSYIKGMVDEHVGASLKADRNGLTPVLRALKAGNLHIAEMLFNSSPAAAKSSDLNGQTYGHLLVKCQSLYFFNRFIRNKESRELLKTKDKQGNTPLHLVVVDGQFELLRVLFKYTEDLRKSTISENEDDDEWVMDLFEIQNTAGKTPNDLLAESPSLPSDIERRILDEKEMIGVLSRWGIPSTEMKTYVNTIGIIAALLTTITFTTAFTVPGGLFQDAGIPVLIGITAFQIFMISDVVAMCLSMMVLCCLLWIMATNNRKNSVMILDFSVTLVLASFFTTLLTFMAGLYATTFPVKPWLAIVIMVLCLILIVVLYYSKRATVICVHKFLRFSRISYSNSGGSTGNGVRQFPRLGSLNNV